MSVWFDGQGKFHGVFGGRASVQLGFSEVHIRFILPETASFVKAKRWGGSLTRPEHASIFG